MINYYLHTLRGATSRVAFLFVFSCLVLGGAMVHAATIDITGLITQSTQNGTGPAVSNPSLNAIKDGQSYTLSLAFPGSLAGAGTYNLTGSTLVFSDSAAPAFDSNFSSISLTVAANGTRYDFSLFACLSGASCFSGNSLSASFSIPVTGFSSSNVVATGLDQPHPFDLLEDGGTTDIQGAITTYSSTGVTAVPEPSYQILCAAVLLASFGVAGRHKQAARNGSRFSHQETK